MDFMFQLDVEEFAFLRSQFVTTKHFSHDFVLSE